MLTLVYMRMTLAVLALCCIFLLHLWLFNSCSNLRYLALCSWNSIAFIDGFHGLLFFFLLEVKWAFLYLWKTDNSTRLLIQLDYFVLEVSLNYNLSIHADNHEDWLQWSFNTAKTFHTTDLFPVCVQVPMLTQPLISQSLSNTVHSKPQMILSMLHHRVLQHSWRKAISAFLVIHEFHMSTIG